MTFRTLLLALALTLPLGAGAARADEDAAIDPAKEAAIRTMLTDQGYEIRSVGMEDGKIEVYAIRDGKMVEIYLDDRMNVLSGAESDQD